MNIIELNEKLRGREVELNQLDFRFIPDFIPTKAVFTGISLKEGFPGTINGDFLIEGYIKGFEDFPVKTFRRKKLFDNFKNVFNVLELKEPLEKVFEEGEDIDLEEEGVIDTEKNVIFLDKIEILPKEMEEEIKRSDSERKIEKFISLTERLIEKKVELKILKFLEDTKPKPQIEIPDELRDFVSPTGMLIEPKPAVKYYSKEKPVIDIKVRGINKIPSVKSVIKKTDEGKKLNFIESLIKDKLTDYLARDVNIWAGTKLLNRELLKISFQREAVRESLKNDGITKLSFKKKLNIDGREFETTLTIAKNEGEPKKDKKEKEPELPF
jgi:hypothetical protein